jgi:hypothetical protein
MHTKKMARWLAALLLAAMGLSACGSSSSRQREQ